MNDPSPTRSSARRVSGRKVGCAFAAFLALAAAGAILTWYLRKDPHGPILAAAPLGDDVVMLRRGYAERGYVHLLRWDPRESRVVWSEPLFGIEPAPALTVGDELVALRAREARGHGEVHAFGLDGAFRWRGARARQEAPDGNPAFSAHPLALVAGRLFVPHATDPVELVLLEVTDGAEVARLTFPAGEGERDLAPFGAGVVLASGDGLLRAVGLEGEVRELGSAAGGWCVLGGDLLVGSPHGLLRLRPGAAEAERVRPGQVGIAACGGASADRLLLTDGRVLRLTDAGAQEEGVAEGLRARPTGQRVGGRYLPIQGALLDLDGPALVALEGLDLRSAEVVAWPGEDAAVVRAGEFLVALPGLERTHLPGLRGARAGREVLWAWTDTELVGLDPRTLTPRAGADGARR